MGMGMRIRMGMGERKYKTNKTNKMVNIICNE
jgi:hypothetical protein